MTAPAPQSIVGSRSACHLPMFALAAWVLLPAAGCGNPSAKPPWSSPTGPTVERPEEDTGPEADADTDADADPDTGCEADMDMTDWPVGALIVGRNNAFGGSENDGSIAAGQNVDGDSFDDILVVSHNWGDWGAAFLYSGPPEGAVCEGDATATIVGVDHPLMPWHVALPGDGNGDGFADVLVAANGSTAHYFLGPLAGTVSLDAADAVIDFSDTYDNGGTVSALGDADSNGTADFLIDARTDVLLVTTPVSGEVTASSVATAALIPEGWHDDPCEHPGYHWYRRGEALGPGDLDGDGVPDLLVSTQNYNRDWPAECDYERGIVYVQYGPVAGTIDLATADAHIDGDLDTTFARDVQPAGDVNGDGLADFLVTYPGYLVLGPASLSGFVSRLPDVVRFEGTNYMSGAGDVDGDGFDDVIAETDAFSVYLGPLGGTVTVEDAAWTFPREDELTGVGSLSPAGDMDDDGLDDFLILANHQVLCPDRRLRFPKAVDNGHPHGSLVGGDLDR